MTGDQMHDSASTSAGAGGAQSHQVSVVVHARARADTIVEAQAAIGKIAGMIAADPDCLEFRVLLDAQDAEVIIFVERSVTEDAARSLFSRPYMAEFANRRDELFQSLEGRFFHELQFPV